MAAKRPTPARFADWSSSCRAAATSDGSPTTSPRAVLSSPNVVFCHKCPSIFKR